MADTGYELDIDASRALIAFTLAGHWTMATVASFRAALKDVYRGLVAKGHPSGSFLILSNSCDHGVQSKDITAALGDLAQEFEDVARKTAVVVASTLHKMQVERVAPSAKICVFSSLDEAKAWLLS